MADEYAELDSTTIYVSRWGDKRTKFHPRDLPGYVLALADIADASEPLRKKQSELAQPAHHRRWLNVYADRQARDRSDAAAFVAASQPFAGAFLHAVPSAPELRMPSSVFEIMVQRRLRAPLAILGNLTYSRALDKNSRRSTRWAMCTKTTPTTLDAARLRHAEPLKLWYAAIRAAYGSSGVKLEDKKHGAYSTTQPDIVRLHAVAAST